MVGASQILPGLVGDFALSTGKLSEDIFVLEKDTGKLLIAGGLKPKPKTSAVC